MCMTCAGAIILFFNRALSGSRRGEDDRQCDGAEDECE